MVQRVVNLAFAVLSMVTWMPVAAEPDDPGVLADRALQANPALEAIEHRIDSLRHEAEAAAAWSDPVLSVEYSNVPWDAWVLDDSPMSGVQLKLQQRLTLPGKNERRRRVIEGRSRVQLWQLEETKNRLRAMVKSTYWRLALVRQLRGITTRHIDLVGQMLETVRVKYQVGKVGQHDLLTLDVLRNKLEDDLGDFDRKDRELTAALNAAMHRDATTPIETPAEISAVESETSAARLLEAAREHRPRLKGLRARAGWHRAAAEQASYERWPDVTVWAGYRMRAGAGADPGTDFVSLGLAVPLPFDYTGSAASTSERHLASAGAEEASYRAEVDRIGAELEASLAAWERAADKATTYHQSLIPQANRTLEATLAAYRTGRADFALLYQAELRLLEYERAARSAAAATRIEKATVEALVGTPVGTQWK